MYLRERRASERVGVDRVEHLPQALAVFLFQTAEHHLIRHRLYVGAQATKLVAKPLRQNLGAVSQNLPHLDEHGAELFEQATKAHRRELVFLVRCHRVGLLGDHIDSARLLASARDSGIDLVDNRRLVTQGI